MPDSFDPDQTDEATPAEDAPEEGLEATPQDDAEDTAGDTAEDTHPAAQS